MALVELCLADVKDAIKSALQPIADPMALKDDIGNVISGGVDIMHSKSKPHLLRIRLISKDGFAVAVDFNCRLMSRNYLDGMIKGIKEGIEQGARTRQMETRIDLLNPKRKLH